MAETGVNGHTPGLFSNCTIAFVIGSSLPIRRYNELRKTVELHDGQVHMTEEQLDLDRVTQIVSNTSDFPEYHDATDRFIPVVKEEWINASLASNLLAHPRKFSPDPNLFLSDVVATCVDLPDGDSEAIAGGIIAMGGNYTSRLTALVTHAVMLDTDNDVYRLIEEKKFPISPVLPHWFDDCLKLGQKISAEPYSFPDPEILRGPVTKAPMSKPSKAIRHASNPSPSKDAPKPPDRSLLKVFRNKKIFLDPDLEISDHLRAVIQGIIESSGGQVKTSPTRTDIYVCKYRDSPNFIQAATQKSDVGNLAWLYWMIVHDEWTSPYRRLLHYPLPRTLLPGFENLKISLSNYTGEARTYLENLIGACGAQCTKTLKQENTHLITAHKRSEKVAAAKDWNINVINHLWIEESYAKWEMQSLTNPRYTHFPKNTNLGEVVGQTQIDRDVINRKFLGIETARNMQTPASGRRQLGLPSSSAPNGSPTRTNAQRTSAVNGTRTPATTRVVEGLEHDTPTTVGSRRSKAAAAEKLHAQAADIQQFQKEMKRVGGVTHGGRRKDDPDRVSEAPSNPRKRSAEPDNAPPRSTAKPRTQAKSEPPTKKQRTSDALTTRMHLLITGKKDWVGHAKKEAEAKEKLKSYGINIVVEPEKATHVAAPHIMRTVKFLCAYAYAPIFLNLEYVDACLEAEDYVEPDGYELVDKEGEKKNGTSLQMSRKRAQKNENKLLVNKLLYCVEKPPAGFDVLDTITQANGATLTPYRGRYTDIPSRRTGTPDADDDEIAIWLLSSDSKDDRKLWPKFTKMAEENRRPARIVRTDWLIECVIRQEVIGWRDYQLKQDKT